MPTKKTKTPPVKAEVVSTAETKELCLIRSVIVHGKFYPAEETHEFPEPVAGQLIDDGAAEPVAPAAEPKPTDEPEE